MGEWASEIGGGLSGGSAEEPEKHRRKREGNLRQCDDEVPYHGITILLTMTPEAHDGSLGYTLFHATMSRYSIGINPHSVWGKSQGG
jgi:hypothetical protein